jgi:hypothetical protein
VPFSVETYGRLGNLAVAFLGMLGGDVGKFGHIAAALRELSVGLYEGNPLMHRASPGVVLGLLAGGSALECCGGV